MESNTLLTLLNEEYEKASNYKANQDSDENQSQKKLRTVRIFISSTFRDFHNERNALVTRVFPRLRDWCNTNFLHLVECDLRWGIPTYVSREETVITCLEEIERGRSESSDMNFFLGLLGERYGWIPDESVVSEFVKNRYEWIEGSSVTLMEFIHGLIRSLTPNGLILFRDTSFLDQLPEIHKSDFIETDLTINENLNMFKIFLKKRFNDKGLVQDYTVEYAGTTYDDLIQAERVEFAGLLQFENIVENHFKSCIKNNLIKYRDESYYECKIDMYHEYMLNCLDRNAKVEQSTIIELLNQIELQFTNKQKQNPIILLTGKAGVGKSTVLAQCFRKLQKSYGKSELSILYHSFGCTLSSKYRNSLLNRLHQFLLKDFNEAQFDTLNTQQKILNVQNALHDGYFEKNNTFFIIILDGIDEVCKINYLKWLTQSTSTNICLIMSCLKEDNPVSFYKLFRDTIDFIYEIEVSHLSKDQLRNIIESYLWDFGKKLDENQLECLMSYEISNNPLWLISACEELRIHGDYSSILKLIQSLPKTLTGINQYALKRFLSQDKNNLLRTFLEVLIESRAGVWESLGKIIIARLTNCHVKMICHKSWLDCLRQIKGFLQVQTIPLPLVKFRHRVMKEAAEEELNISDERKEFIHKTLVDIYEPLIETGSVYLQDYMFHLMKTNLINKLIKFLRSRNSWTLIKNFYVRRKFIQSLRCKRMIVHTDLKTPYTNYIKICLFCQNNIGQLSLFTTNKDACFICGSVLGGNGKPLRTCSMHSLNNMYSSKCSLCEKYVDMKRHIVAQICITCQTFSPNNTCGIIMTEKDLYFNEHMKFWKHDYKMIHFL